jgi:VWFA-related protein
MSVKGLRLLAGVAAAWTAVAVSAQQQQPVFRAGVELVQIDAVVTAANDRPAGGLTAADFEIFENGRRQTIVDFRAVSAPRAARRLDPKGTPSAVVANDEPPNRRLFVIVVDNASIRPVDMRTSRELLTALLQGLSTDDQVAMVTTAASPASLELTSDPVLQARAVAALDARAGTPWGFTSRPGHEISFDILENVIESLAYSRHARRVVVYVGPLFPMSLTWVDRAGTVTLLREGYSRTVEAARRANVAVYAVHSAGPDNLGNLDGLQDFASFAGESGGRGFGAWSDYRTVARQILDDNSTFYVMSYYRDPANVRDREPAIDVRPNRKGLTVRARRGYVARAAATPAVATLSDSLSEPLSIAGVQLRASVTPAGATTGERVPTDLMLEVIYPPEAGRTRITDQLEFGVVALDYDARVLAKTGRLLPVDIVTASGETRHVIRETIELPPGPAVIRLGVSSRTLNSVGTVHVPVRIPVPARR